jgi:predicted NBD/HSP70 family sugar kinase
MPDSFSEMRKRNAARVLELVRMHGELSRADLARLADLSKATVSSITAELIESDLLRETGSITTEKGRRPVGLVFNPTGKLAVGISIDDQRNIIAVVTDMDGRVLGAAREKLDGELAGDAVKHVLDKVEFDRSRLCAAGLAVPGPVSHDGDGLYNRVAVELANVMHHKMELQTLVDMAAMAEAHVGKLPANRLVLFVRTSHRLRSTLLYGGRLISNHNEFGGEPGHVVAPWISERCSCGKTGCVNTHVGSAELIGRAAQAGLHVATVDALVEAANGGDERAANIVREAGSAVGYAVGGLLNVLAPVTVIMSGALTHAGEIFFAPLREAVSTYAMSENIACSDVVPSSLGDDSAAAGAAVFALANMESLFDSANNGVE